MIIVEGPDGAGKTTLVRHLAEKFNLPVAPKIVSSSTEPLVESKKAWCEHNVGRGFQMSLFDRHCLISEPIYNSTLKKYFEPGFDDFGWLFSMNYTLYNSVKPLLIYCLPPYQVVRTNLEGDENNEVVIHKIRRIYAQYAAKAASDVALYNAFQYDYTEDSTEVVEKWIRISLDRLADDVRTF